jgi:very-short-patch-repair endonuclease
LGAPRNRQLGGYKFVRQMSIGRYFADFVCRERKVIVEVDGGTHSTDGEVLQDAKRTSALRALGYRVFRTFNDDIYRNIDYALDALLAFLEESGG